MVEVLSVLILLMEILMVLQCMQIVFGKSLKFDKYMFGLIVADFAIYLSINLKIIPMICSALFYILIFGYCYVEFKQSILKTFIRFIVGIILVGCVEGIVAFVTNLFRNENNSSIVLFLSSLLSLGLVYIIKKCTYLFSGKNIIKSNNAMLGITVFYGIALISFLIDYYRNQGLLNIYVVGILTVIVLIFVYLYRLEQAKSEIITKNYELELHKIYGEAYEKLLSEVRKRQHDYKNQLSTMKSMHLVANSIEELVDMQQEYEGTLKSECRFDSILTCCNNQILAGFIYYRCISCENKGINVDYDISIDEAKCSFAIHEIIEILGILIDNACENCIEENTDRCIKLKFYEDEDRMTLSVSNPGRYITFSEIGKMFESGYSSKGENRGIGLARVSELCKKHSVEIEVHNITEGEINWINFIIEIAK